MAIYFPCVELQPVTSEYAKLTEVKAGKIFYSSMHEAATVCLLSHSVTCHPSNDYLFPKERNIMSAHFG